MVSYRLKSLDYLVSHWQSCDKCLESWLSLVGSLLWAFWEVLNDDSQFTSIVKKGPFFYQVRYGFSRTGSGKSDGRNTYDGFGKCFDSYVFI